jgi:hypothetical protein
MMIQLIRIQSKITLKLNLQKIKILIWLIKIIKYIMEFRKNIMVKMERKN